MSYRDFTNGAAANDPEQVRAVLERINTAWLEGPPDQIPAVMGECFDDSMVIRGAKFEVLADGKAACIQTYTDFLQQAEISECTLGDAAIDVTGDTAVAVYSWEMTYILDATEYAESGFDIFVFTRMQGRWLAMWRTMLPMVEEE